MPGLVVCSVKCSYSCLSLRHKVSQSDKFQHFQRKSWKKTPEAGLYVQWRWGCLEREPDVGWYKDPFDMQCLCDGSCLFCYQSVFLSMGGNVCAQSQYTPTLLYRHFLPSQLTLHQNSQLYTYLYYPYLYEWLTNHCYYLSAITTLLKYQVVNAVTVIVQLRYNKQIQWDISL